MVEKDYNTEIISDEIRKLINSVESFINKNKNFLREDLINMYLTTSNNN